jgi:uncharacterized protein YbaR (Trm112 family)
MSHLRPELLEIIACPVCKGKLQLVEGELHCQFDQLAFPVRDGVPVLIVDETRSISDDSAK